MERLKARSSQKIGWASHCFISWPTIYRQRLCLVHNLFPSETSARGSSGNWLTFFLQLISCHLRTSKICVQMLSLEIWDMSVFVRPKQTQQKIWKIKLSASCCGLPNFPINIFKQEDEVQYFTRLNEKVSEKFSNQTSSNTPYMGETPPNLLSQILIYHLQRQRDSICRASAYHIATFSPPSRQWKLQKPLFGNHLDE